MKKTILIIALGIFASGALAAKSRRNLKKNFSFKAYTEVQVSKPDGEENNLLINIPQGDVSLKYNFNKSSYISSRGLLFAEDPSNPFEADTSYLLGETFVQYAFNKKISLKTGVILTPLGYFEDNIKTFSMGALGVGNDKSSNIDMLSRSPFASHIKESLGLSVSYKHNPMLDFSAGILTFGYEDSVENGKWGRDSICVIFCSKKEKTENSQFNSNSFSNFYASANLNFKKYKGFATFVMSDAFDKSKKSNLIGVGGKTSYKLKNKINLQVRGEAWAFNHNKGGDTSVTSLRAYVFPELTWKEFGGGALLGTHKLGNSYYNQYILTGSYKITKNFSVVVEKFFQGGQKTLKSEIIKKEDDSSLIGRAINRVIGKTDSRIPSVDTSLITETRGAWAGTLKASMNF